ncbi:MAG: UDP-3-O-acyl-N-acetylglucosamine deacetylase [Pseudomonadota bacterium]
MQATLRTSLTFSGPGLHSGMTGRVTVRPAPAEYGIWFRRVDADRSHSLIAARYHNVRHAPLCTRLANAADVSVSTVEHIMAALAGCGVHNALIEVEGPEIPILDGSAISFVEAIVDGGLRMLDVPVRAIEVLKSVEVSTGSARARLDPADSLSIGFEIEFPDAAIGRQSKCLNMANGAFVRELCNSRTFCREADVIAMHDRGLALGGTYENAVVFDGARVLSPGGLRHADEAVRHKMLDALGDLALAGAPLVAAYTGTRAGHAITNELLHALFADPAAYRMIEMDPARAACLPGAGVTRTDLSLIA